MAEDASKEPDLEAGHAFSKTSETSHTNEKPKSTNDGREISTKDQSRERRLREHRPKEHRSKEQKSREHRSREQKSRSGPSSENFGDTSDQRSAENGPLVPQPDGGTSSDTLDVDEADEYDDEESCRVCGIRTTNLSRLLKVFMAFPYVIIVSAIKPTGRWAWMRSNFYIRLNNLMIYILPFFLVHFILEKYKEPIVQILTVAVYMALYLLPVSLVVFSKIDIVRTSKDIEDGTFCFKPARTVRMTEANIYQVMGFFFEWVQHVFYVLPVGVVTGEQQARLQDFPPYLPFSFFFWTCVFSVFACCIILILNAVLRGKALFKFQRTGWVWYFCFNIGQPMFMSIVTVMYMGIWCDYNVEPPVLVQDPNMKCFSDEHSYMLRAALMCLALYVVQHTLLPSGTFKETMGDDSLDIMFVPVYMSANLLLKAVFCGIYVFFYQNNMFRIWALTTINVINLWVNHTMNPSSIAWVNLARSTIFLHATLSGIQSLNYVMWPITDTTGHVLVSTLASNIIFTSIAMWSVHFASSKGGEHAIATAFLDLEWQVEHGGNIQPRVLEPLVSLTLSQEKKDWDITRKYVDKLVWLLSHKYTRVQFQSAWALANMAILEEDLRLKIHKAGGTRTLLEWYNEMDFPVQLEALAALANLSLSKEVCEAMVIKHKCIPFFLQIIVSTKVKHSHFALVSLGNISRMEEYRKLICQAGGMHVLFGCIMTRDHLKLKFAALALANLLLSETFDIADLLRLRGLLSRIIKIQSHNNADTMREVTALIRNMSCHPLIVEGMLTKGIMKVVENATKSPYANVPQWAEDTKTNLDIHIENRKGQDTELSRHEGNFDETDRGSNVAAKRREKIGVMEPLSGCVEWSTWGSKLDTVFSPVFSHLPIIGSQHVHALAGQHMSIKLSADLPPSMVETIVRYKVVDEPGSGRLSEYETSSEYITYTPNAGFVGNDIFSYRACVDGGLETVPSTVTVSIVDSTRGVRRNNDPVNTSPTNDNSKSDRKRRSSAGRSSFALESSYFGEEADLEMPDYDNAAGNGKVRRPSNFSMSMSDAKAARPNVAMGQSQGSPIHARRKSGTKSSSTLPRPPTKLAGKMGGTAQERGGGRSAPRVEL